MIERPLPCTSEEVRAIRSNLKAQSRSLRGLRWINENPDHWILMGEESLGLFIFEHVEFSDMHHAIRCPWGVAGDRLWVQETWAPFEYSYEDTVPSDLPSYCHIVYRVDCNITASAWRSSTQMPRWASRDTLENVSVRPERLRCITREDCLAEGIIYNPSVVVQNSRVPALYSHGTTDGFPTAKDAYHDRWDSRHGKAAPWAENKWVWRIEHRRVNER